MLNFIHWNVRPEIFSFSDFPRWYGLMWCIGFMAAYYVIQRLFTRREWSPAYLDALTIYVVTGCLVGARLGHILFYNPDYYWNHPLEALLPFSFENGFHFIGYQGLASHGATIGIPVATALFARRMRVPFRDVLDDLAIVAALVGGMIRIGNLLNSEMIGTPTEVPWAFIFVRVDMIPRHPAQLYEAIFCLLLSAALLWIRLGITRIQPGFITGLFLVVLFTQRILNESLKLNQEPFEDAMILNMGQILSIPMILAGLYLMFMHRDRQCFTS